MFSFGIKDVIDIFLVALLLYYIYRLMKETSSANIFTGIIIFIITWILVSQVFEMRLLGSILDKMISIGSIGLIVLFQSEIRQFFSTIGARRSSRRLLQLLSGKNAVSRGISEREVEPIVMACANMSKNRVGALIVIERGVGLSEYVRSGDEIDARINQRLLENIFFKNSPLHDGAVIISHSRIKAAGCILPVSHSLDVPRNLGLRHRAALGITQQTDALSVVVSEETGGISTAMGGHFRLNISPKELERELLNVME